MENDVINDMDRQQLIDEIHRLRAIIEGKERFKNLLVQALRKHYLARTGTAEVTNHDNYYEQC